MGDADQRRAAGRAAGMQAVRLHGVADARVERVDTPAPAGGEALVATAYAGVCGSDLHVYGRGMFVQDLPVTMGHEFSGRIAALGTGAVAEIGAAVVGDPRVGCGECVACLTGRTNLCPALGFIGEVRPGCFAQYVALPVDRLITLPEGVDLKWAALAEPLAVAIHTTHSVSLSSGDEVVVFGAGPVGVLSVALAVRRDCAVTVVEPLAERRCLARAAGAACVYERSSELASNQFDVAVEAAGKDAALSAAIASVKPGGRVAAVGIYEDLVRADLTALVGKEIALVGVSAYERSELEAASKLVAEPALQELFARLVTDEVPLSAVPDVLDRLRSGWGSGKVLIKVGCS